jgi:hypothetical protein
MRLTRKVQSTPELTELTQAGSSDAVVASKDVKTPETSEV